ncbi:sugar ABC transporter permease [Streptomyces chumphonensis]|uniref:Sugar ABC transporter permease n=1 Tax=Streptomyces chumphonensis TaxID=1214925 RepID=A0A927EZD3_9ACTN|nr:sugar ABC transporter permease [Streptomyces chumphonensis]MBD3931429.1 sugar ABC transporter permease [Streptomyces chumphonensis]
MATGAQVTAGPAGSGTPDGPEPPERTSAARRLRPAEIPLFVLAFLLPPRLTPSRVKHDRRYRTLDKYRFVCGFLALPLAIYAVFVVSPFVQAFYYSLTDWTGYSADFTFVGLENYERLLDDSDFWASLTNSLTFLVLAPALTLGLGLFFAFMLRAGGRRARGEAISGVRGAKFYTIVYFFPQVISVAIIGVVWAAVYDPITGPLNEAFRAVGLDGLAQNWLADPDLALWSVLFVLCWSFIGFYVVLFSAAMGSVPKDIYEAALLDGAGRTVTFFRVTLPLIGDSVRTGWIYMGIQALDAFAIVHIMTINKGGPGNSTLVTPVYLYKKAFESAQAGYATAIGVVLLLVTMAFAAIMMLVGRRERIEY